MTRRSLLPAALCLALVSIAHAQSLIAPTEPLTPEQERATFRVPEGFDIQLVAAEPDIQKPMNMKFDAKGRLWVTHSIEYPFPVKEGATGRDGVTILSDFGPDGRARKVQRFADGLNIPIGIVPIKDGCIVWSIPHIWKLTDTDGDDVADKREVLFTGFGIDDTHGNQNNFTRWVDGWIYACHGFRNDSKIRKGTDGEVVLHIQSGNTYRFKEDGSAIEQWTTGQVNPFGLTFDPLGNIYTADCHSRPLTMLIRGANYPSFGRPHDGLGYAPEMIDHDHGSTGISGIAYYAADHFPAQYRDCLYTGNVITNRVHRDAIIWTGTTPRADTKEDFIVSDDPWFRPVDVQLGSDGALYVADFYNRIIGHYELPLDHPGRDKERGRIWRVVYKNSQLSFNTDFHDAKSKDLVGRMGDANLTNRVLALNRLVERDGVKVQALLLKEVFGDAKSLVPNVFKKDEKKKPTDDTRRRAMAVWALARTGNLKGPTLDSLRSQSHAEPEMQAHLLMATGEKAAWDGEDRKFVTKCLNPQEVSKVGPLESKLDRPVAIRRIAAETLGRHPDAGGVKPLLALWDSGSKEDLRLFHTVKIALREHLKQPAIAESLAGLDLNDAENGKLAEVAVSAPNPAAAAFVLDYIKAHEQSPDQLATVMPYLASNLPQERVDELGTLTREKFTADPEFQLTLVGLIRQSLSERGAAPSPALRSWALELVGPLLATQDSEWVNYPHPDKPSRDNPWGLQERPLAEGGTAMLLSSHPPEQLTGVLRSAAFALPAKLSFSMCGHNGLPTTNPPAANYIRLVLAESGKEVAREIPPRNDTAKRYTWDLAGYEGQRGYIEVIDGDTAGTFAWIAVGQFDPAVVKVPTLPPAELIRKKAEALNLAGALNLTETQPIVASILNDIAADPALRIAAADALRSIKREDVVVASRRIIANVSEPEPLRAHVANLLGQSDDARSREPLLLALPTAPEPFQQKIALALAAKPQNAEALLEAIEQGKASPRLLQQPPIVARLKSHNLPDLDGRIAKLTEGLLPADERIAQLIADRRTGYLAAKPDAARGQAAFTRVCAACHQIATQGARIGPTLDGIGNRGLDRLLEDVLDPNRNIDAAFRFNTITTKGGGAFAGMVLRTEGQTLILADTLGQEQRINEADIDQRQELKLSLMPVSLADAIPEPEFYDLLAYLLTQRPEPEK